MASTGPGRRTGPGRETGPGYRYGHAAMGVSLEHRALPQKSVGLVEATSAFGGRGLGTHWNC